MVCVFVWWVLVKMAWLFGFVVYSCVFAGVYSDFVSLVLICLVGCLCWFGFVISWFSVGESCEFGGML